jgi:hypothetical protein
MLAELLFNVKGTELFKHLKIQMNWLNKSVPFEPYLALLRD